MYYGDIAGFKTIQRVIHEVKPTHIIHLGTSLPFLLFNKTVLICCSVLA
jgi:hypothetical protein